MVVFDPDEPVQSILTHTATKCTTLTQFFYINGLDDNVGEEAQKLTYQDIPHKFVWHKDSKTWTKRRKGFSLGHMFFVPPTAGERFYLRTLLCVCRSPRSFQELHTFQDVKYATF